MKIREIRRIVTEDFPNKYKDLIDPLAFALNPFLESMVNALNNQLTYKDNFNSQLIDIEVRAPINPDNPLTIRVDKVRGRVTEVRVQNLTNLVNNSAVLSAAPFVEFDQVTENSIQIRNITGLTENTRYRLYLIVYGS